MANVTFPRTQRAEMNYAIEELRRQRDELRIQGEVQRRQRAEQRRQREVQRRLEEQLRRQEEEQRRIRVEIHQINARIPRLPGIRWEIASTKYFITNQLICLL